VGLELLYFGAAGGYVQAYNRNTSAYTPLNLTGSTVTVGASGGYVVLSGGYVGIGTAGPNYLLHVGSSSASGAVAGFQNSADLCTLTPAASTPTWSCSSDIRLKTDIADTGDALAQLGTMRVRNFTMKATGERQTGVIAQELQAAHPDMVHLGPNGFYTVDSPNPWQLVKAIQELGTENDNLRAELKAASDNEAAQIGALTVRLNALESRRR
jgi:hypothetical protein